MSNRAYQLTVFFGSAMTNDQATEEADKIATRCDELFGRPATPDSELTYFLILHEALPADEEGFLHWLQAQKAIKPASVIAIPTPYSPHPLQ